MHVYVYAKKNVCAQSQKKNAFPREGYLKVVSSSNQSGVFSEEGIIPLAWLERRGTRSAAPSTLGSQSIGAAAGQTMASRAFWLVAGAGGERWGNGRQPGGNPDAGTPI